jgi:hypothetical protein
MPLAKLLGRQQGYLDAADARFATGWVFDPSAPNTPLEVELLVDGQAKGMFLADRFREDLRKAGKGDGRHGFEIPLPTLAGAHEVGVRVRGASRPLRGSPKSVVGTGVAMGGEQPMEAHGALTVVVETTGVGGEAVEPNLRALIACVSNLDVEIIAADAGSTDDTPRRLTVLARECPAFRWIVGDHAQAVQQARHELVLLLTGDSRPATPNLLAHHVLAHADGPRVVRGRIDGGWPAPPGSMPNNTSIRRGGESAPVAEAPLAAVAVPPTGIREAMRAHVAAGALRPLELPPCPAPPRTEDWLAVVEGVKAWASVLHRHHRLGSQPWHAAYIDAVLELCHSQGRAMAAQGDPSAAYAAMLERFEERVASAASEEALSRLVRGVSA